MSYYTPGDTICLDNSRLLNFMFIYNSEDKMHANFHTILSANSKAQSDSLVTHYAMWT